MAITAQAQIDVTWTQAAAVPAAGWYVVTVDGQAVSGRIAAWPGGVGLGGFGRGRFGRGRFGGQMTGFAFGVGRFGRGGFGIGEGRLSYRTPPMPDGQRTVRVLPYDAAGNVAAAEEHPTAVVAVAGSPEAPTNLACNSYEDGNITITFAKSVNDG